MVKRSHSDTSSPSPTYQVFVQIDDEFLDSVDVKSIETAVQETLGQLQIESGSLTVVITDDEEIRRLNRDFRQIDAPTDVLSFTAETEQSDDSIQIPDEVANELEGYLGDLIIAYPYAAAQAIHFGNSIEAELRLLTVHGTLHLLGYDHDNAENKARMWAAQEMILARLGIMGLSDRSYQE